MPRYTPLVELLKNTTGDTVNLELKAIDALVEGLPGKARESKEWWTSHKKTSQLWAHAWLEEGWKATVTFANGMVRFQRYEKNTLLDSLRPRTKQTVMSQVEKAQISVERWKVVDGRQLEIPQSNTAFCFNWSFGSPSEGYVLCVWHSGLTTIDDRVEFPCDIGTHTRNLKKELERPALTASQRSRLNIQLGRSEAFQQAVEWSYYSGKRLKFILNLGDQREDDELAEQKSTVSERELDSADWYVHGLTGGDALIVRGVPRPDMDGGGLPPGLEPPSDPGQDDAWRLRLVSIRRGQPAFRALLLEAYEGRCAVTGTALPDLLEAAHIIPHAEGTNYRASNGLLLRADIHTLYDLHHLSVDGDGRVHLSAEAKTIADYGKLHHARIRFPAKTTLSPDGESMSRRHRRFLEREGARPKMAAVGKP